MQSSKIAELKSAQFVLIAQAGLAISEMAEMKLDDIQTTIFKEFRGIVDNYVIPDNLKGDIDSFVAFKSEANDLLQLRVKLMSDVIITDS